jgi:hypothetical protein
MPVGVNNKASHQHQESVKTVSRTTKQRMFVDPQEAASRRGNDLVDAGGKRPSPSSGNGSRPGWGVWRVRGGG